MRREVIGTQRRSSYVTRSGVQNPDIQKLLGQAIVNCITGNRSEFGRLCELAAARHRIETDKNRLHASIKDILLSKGQEVTFTICH